MAWSAHLVWTAGCTKLSLWVVRPSMGQAERLVRTMGFMDRADWAPSGGG